MRFLVPKQYVGFLEGQTYPAKFCDADSHWVVRCPGDKAKNLRLASEFIGYRIAGLLGVPLPRFEIVTITESFRACHEGKIRTVQAGLATACEYLESARYPNFECDELDGFWEQEEYLVITATGRIADTWIMNYDRRKKGNLALTGEATAPHLWFLDFDQSFLSKKPSQLHWIDRNFDEEWLNDDEVLSGFSGRGGARSESIQRASHFQPAIDRMMSIGEAELQLILDEIPAEWDISDSSREQWLKYFLLRRNVAAQNVRKKYAR